MCFDIKFRRSLNRLHPGFLVPASAKKIKMNVGLCLRTPCCTGRTASNVHFKEHRKFCCVAAHLYAISSNIICFFGSSNIYSGT